MPIHATASQRRSTVLLAYLFAAAFALPLTGAMAADETSTQTDKPITHATESLESCMQKWDPGTHMTKEAWRQSCLRLRNERAPYVRDK
ncbi:MAG: hypothetical protein WC829_18425 [Hyphomicrobium sp.]|jgi:hypothetical protein